MDAKNSQDVIDNPGPAGSDGKWYAADEFTADQLPQADRYKTRADFHKAFFEQGAAISRHVGPPDPKLLKPDEYAAKLKAYRLQAGALSEAKDVQIEWPADLQGY